jgi:hypothetical protein
MGVEGANWNITLFKKLFFYIRRYLVGARYRVHVLCRQVTGPTAMRRS